MIKYFQDGSIRSKHWIKHGIIHRDVVPSYINYLNEEGSRLEVWHINGYIHNRFGPAKIEYDYSKCIHVEWWIKATKLSFDDWLNKCALLEYKKVKLKLKYG